MDRLLAHCLALFVASMVALAAPADERRGVDAAAARSNTPPSRSRTADESVPSKTRPRNVRIPGLVIDFERRCVDLEARVCVNEGLLELIACTKGTKEHESIVAVKARPMHVHTALLALGATAGNPAMRKRVEDDSGARWVEVPPRGGRVSVSLVVEDAKGNSIEHPISRFVTRDDPTTKADESARHPRFPQTFLFTGSLLRTGADGKRDYVCDETGNVISIATFGDELLGLPEVHTRDNAALVWRADPQSLPKVGSKVVLRLRPRPRIEKPAREPAKEER